METNSFNEYFRFDDDGFFTYSSTEQKRIEDLVFERATQGVSKDDMDTIDDSGDNQQNGDNGMEKNFTLYRSKHVEYVIKSLNHLPVSYENLDASRPWMCYWGVHALRVLNHTIDDDLKSRMIAFLKSCQSETGGFGGGPGQEAHLATTYAAVLALCSLDTDEAYDAINRKTLYSFLCRMKQPSGSFRMHRDGEEDVRGAYCAISVASLTSILDARLTDRAETWIISCQTYEGGFAATNGCEAHGGYTFCAVAAMIILGHTRLIDLKSLLNWLVLKQRAFEGGFQGRTNKLVDACYSFWQAAVFPLIEEIIGQRHPNSRYGHGWLYSHRAAQQYVLACCQDHRGGLMDKPSKGRDLYHTCYALSGLSTSQHLRQDETDVVGKPSNLLVATHPVYNIVLDAEKKARTYFSKLPSVN